MSAMPDVVQWFVPDLPIDYSHSTGVVLSPWAGPGNSSSGYGSL